MVPSLKVWDVTRIHESDSESAERSQGPLKLPPHSSTSPSLFLPFIAQSITAVVQAQSWNHQSKCWRIEDHRKIMSAIHELRPDEVGTPVGMPYSLVPPDAKTYDYIIVGGEQRGSN